MPTVFLDEEKFNSGEITISGEKAHHLLRVLRVAPGDALVLMDGQGGRYQGLVRRVGRDQVIVEAGTRETPDLEPNIGIHLVQGLPKADKMAWIVEKATELGVGRISPVITARSEVKRTRRFERWQRIAESAAAQSGRLRIPVVSEPRPFRDVLEEIDTPGLICWEATRAGMRGGMDRLPDGLSAMALFIGPEGGFTPGEVAAAEKRGHVAVSLGPRILRTETAPIVALSLILFEKGELD